MNPSDDNLKFRYQPSPIGFAKPVLEKNHVESVANFPPTCPFEDHAYIGNPYTARAKA
jgi:hypothetical protein